MRYSNAPLSAASMVASYGIYHDENLRTEEDDGFISRSGYAYRGVIVNASGNSSVVRSNNAANQNGSAANSSSCGWCVSSTGSRTSHASSWCRPTILLLLLVLLVVVFVLISGILLYFNYMTYKPRHAITEEPCDKTFCAWGASCVTGPDGRALCQCPTYCRPVIEPVCGTDGKTYANHCQLKVASCRARHNTRVKYHGECELSDPCRDKHCGFGARCVPSADGRNATCQCPDRCPNYGDHSTSRPVCGSDGADYTDQCELRMAACISGSNITVKFAGKCDPCAGVTCAEPEICQLDDNRNPVCRCGDTCPLEFTPVCGSDGKTYSNECTLRQEACRARKTLNIIYRGKCSSGVNPCTRADCKSGEECTINKYGIARCECPPPCEPIMRPVCSRDGRTYPSECDLRRSACLQRTTIEIAHTGTCGEMGPCSEHMCYHGAACVERGGTAHCECPICPAEFEPVCGSDGISYGNECKLRLESCKHRRQITVLYKGPCNGCENKKCDFYSTCESDGATEGRCVCPQSCLNEKSDNIVCGTDGITYDSECDLKVASCRQKQYILVAYKGDCDLCQGVQCKFGARCEAGDCVCPTNCEGSGVEPVCASNMITYNNECELQKASCLQPKNAPQLTVVFYGECHERFAVTGPVTTLVPPTVHTDTKIIPLTRTTDAIDVITGSIDISLAEREACKDIHCDFEATCELGPGNFPRCSCQFDCDSATVIATSKPVCASDHRIYPSLCAMKMEACQRQEELRLRPLDLCQGMEVKPCNGEKPLADPLTGKELDCGNGPSRQDCPSGSYCHQTTRFARCCIKDQSVQQKSCEDSWYGCCPDGKTPAQGVDHAGCPSMCGCNKLGSYSDTCDPETQQCHCKPGVGGLKCDRCEPGYWGLPKISSGHQGCIPCGCSTFGSVRDDCEQMTGRCVCKLGVQGQKCTMCIDHDKILGPNGCSLDVSTPPPTTCQDLVCHFGATCTERNGLAFCECHLQCPNNRNTQVVCGNDGQTYISDCQLRLVACRSQQDIVVQAFGACKEDMFAGTDWPIRRYTTLQFTQSDDSNSPLSKSTRHLLVPDPRYYYERGSSKNGGTTYNRHDTENNVSSENNLSTGTGSIYSSRGFAGAFRPTPATVRIMTALLGDICTDDSDCVITHSNCVKGACLCLPEYSESPDRQECIANLVFPTEEVRACISMPCLHGGTCIDLPNVTFTCVCNAKFTGPLCETNFMVKQYDIPAFDGRSYIRLKPIKAYHKLSIEIEFKTYSGDGIILYNQQHANGTGDFVSLALVKGFVEFRYNLGNGPVVITSPDKVQIKKFHKVIIKRYHKDGILNLDDEEEVAGQSSGILKALDLVEDAYLGYIPSNFTRVYENIGTHNGFLGCIRKMKIGRRVVELHEHHDELVLETHRIRQCGENPCTNVPCQNGGICHTLDFELFRCECGPFYSGEFCETTIDSCLSNPCKSGSTCEPSLDGKFFCKCLPGQRGPLCEHVITDVDLSLPEFNSSSFIEFPKLEGIGKTFSIEVVFLTRTSNGLILYNGQMNRRGDFLSLNLVNGYVQFRFNLGSGIANITSRDLVKLNEWHWVRIKREGREGTLEFDNSTVLRGFSGPHLTELNLELPFYIGSVKFWQEIHPLSGASKPFDGVIQRILLNGKHLQIFGHIPQCSSKPLSISRCGHNIGKYNGAPCPLSKNPCKNDGICMPNFSNYICHCHSNFEGKYCEILKDNERTIKFNGETFLQYKNRGYRKRIAFFSTNNTNETYNNNNNGRDENEDDGDVMGEGEIDFHEIMHIEYEEDEYDNEESDIFEIAGRKGEKANRYEIKFRTSLPNGVLLWRSKTRNLKEDYLSIAINDGFPELSFNLGKQKSFWYLRSKIRVNDGEWHTIHVRRRKRVGFLSVDGETPIRGLSERGAISLSTNSKLWIGGMPSLPPGLPQSYYSGFVGCIHHVTINSRPLNLLKHTDPSILQFCHDNEI